MIPRDKLLHIGLGLIALPCAYVALWVNSLLGLGACLAYTTTVVGGLYEWQQWFRKEGHPDPWDAFCTALPGFVAWGLLELL